MYDLQVEDDSNLLSCGETDHEETKMTVIIEPCRVTSKATRQRRFLPENAKDRVLQWVLGSYVKERKHNKLMSQVVRQLIPQNRPETENIDRL